MNTNEGIDTEKRLVYLDYSRVLGAYLVVFGHCLPAGNPIRVFIYAFHMPFFFLVSGILHKQNDDLMASLNKYFRTLLVPMMFFLSIMLIPHLFVHDALDSVKSTIFGIYISRDITLNLVTWFLLVLFYVKVIFSCALKYKKFLFSVFIWIALCLLTQHSNAFFIGQAIMALPFYAVGYFCRDYINNILLNKITWKSLFLVPVFAVVVYMLNNLNGRTSMNYCLYGDLQLPLNVVCFYIKGLIGSAMLLLPCMLIKKGNNLIRKLAGSLISILGLQWAFVLLYIKRASIPYDLWGGGIIPAVASILIMFLCFSAHLFIEKYIPQLYGRKKKQLVTHYDTIFIS